MLKFETSSVDNGRIVNDSVDALFNDKGIDRISAWVFKTPQEKNALFGELVGIIEAKEGWFDVWLKGSTVELLPRLGYGVQIARDLLGRSAKGRRNLRLSDLDTYPPFRLRVESSAWLERATALEESLKMGGKTPQWVAIRVDVKPEKMFFIVMMEEFRQPIGYDLERSGLVEPCVWEDAPVLY